MNYYVLALAALWINSDVTFHAALDAILIKIGEQPRTSFKKWCYVAFLGPFVPWIFLSVSKERIVPME